MKKLPKINTSKLLKAALPYILVGLMATKLGQAYRMASGGDVLDRIFGAFLKIGEAFASPLPSLHPFDLLVGAACGALLWFIVYQKSKNARKYRRGAEYGTARWGNAKDIEPFIDPDFSQNILLSETERLTLGKIADPEKRNVNLNVLVIGGSGSGKTRYHIKPNLLQMNASYVCSDPKGTVIEEVGRALVRGGYKIKVLNTIDFSCSMHYNPFVYLHSETDILTLVTVIMTNTQGEAKGGDDFWQKAEALLYQALIAYIYYEAPAEERNMNTLLDMFGSIGQTVATAVQEHKGGLVMAGAIAMLIIMVFSSLSSCSVMMDGAMSAVLGTSYTSEDPDIIQTEANYTALETALQNELANIERTHPGYDEYRYDVDSIGHNPNELISYLTAKFDAFTPAQVQAEMETMFDRQYSLTTREVVEIRTRTVTSTDPETGETTEDEEEYEYYILYVTLRNKGFGAVALENLDEEQKERYTATLSLKGNKPYLFGSDIYANESAGEDYDIPGEALADPDFAALIAEAEKYLGFPYVWGGSSPSTSFDCSGFVCYVYTHSGVHNLPRTTAQGIYNQCAHIPMSEAKPGDIIFFTGTYNSPGPVSHVGIYVGNNMMIHCGSPIQYARTDSSYWSQHFYAIGRLN